MSLRCVIAHTLYRQPFAVHHRMVRHNQLTACGNGLVSHVLGDIQRHQNTLDLLLGISQQLAYIIPAKSQFLRCQCKKALFNFTDRTAKASLNMMDGRYIDLKSREIIDVRHVQLGAYEAKILLLTN